MGWSCGSVGDASVSESDSPGSRPSQDLLATEGAFMIQFKQVDNQPVNPCHTATLFPKEKMVCV